jgi:hypothetical protein
MYDHKDRNHFNNQKENLRPCGYSQNCANVPKVHKGTSKYKGVSFCSQTKRWRAQIMRYRKQVNIGRFDTEEEAARAYDAKAVEIFGEFAFLNFPIQLATV